MAHGRQDTALWPAGRAPDSRRPSRTWQPPKGRWRGRERAADWSQVRHPTSSASRSCSRIQLRRPGFKTSGSVWSPCTEQLVQVYTARTSFSRNCLRVQVKSDPSSRPGRHVPAGGSTAPEPRGASRPCAWRVGTAVGARATEHPPAPYRRRASSRPYRRAGGGNVPMGIGLRLYTNVVGTLCSHEPA